MMTMKNSTTKGFLLATIFCFSIFFITSMGPQGAGHAQDLTEIHCKQFILGIPLGTPATNDLIIRDIYALSSNDSTKFADWVA
jgi:hypothetical protein